MFQEVEDSYGYLLPPLDCENVFKSTSGVIIPSNIESTMVSDVAEQYLKNIFQDEDKLDFIASCDCGPRSNYYIGDRCPKCKQIITTGFDRIDFTAWFEIPTFLPPLPHPDLYRKLKSYLGSKNKIPIINLILDIDSDVLPNGLEGYVGRGLWNFYNNFDSIMEYLTKVYPPNQRKAIISQSIDVQNYISAYRDRLFVRHLPILNKSLHVLTKVGSIKRTDKSAPFVVDTLVELSNLEYSYRHRYKSQEYLDKHLLNVYQYYIKYIDSIINDKLIKKKGLLRRQLYGTRLYNTGRAVIIPLTGPHNIDDIHIPWRMGVAMYKLEIINILMNRKQYGLNEALQLHNKALMEYVEEVDEIFKILIEECPYGRLP